MADSLIVNSSSVDDKRFFHYCVFSEMLDGISYSYVKYRDVSSTTLKLKDFFNLIKSRKGEFYSKDEKSNTYICSFKHKAFVKHFWQCVRDLIKLSPEHEISLYEVINGSKEEHNMVCYSEETEVLLSWYKNNKGTVLFCSSNYEFCCSNDITMPIMGTETYHSLFLSLYEEIIKSNINKKIISRNTAAKNNYSAINCYIAKLKNYCPTATVIRIDFGYKERHSKFVDEIDKDIDRFYTNKRHKPSLFKELVGYITKLEYSFRKGFYWRTFLFLRCKIGISRIKEIGDYWVNVITKEKGIYYHVPNSNPQSFTLAAFNKLMDNYFFLEKDLLKAAKYLCEKERLVKPITKKNMKLLRKGRLNFTKDIMKIPIQNENTLGRKRTINREEILTLYQQGLSATDIAKQMVIGRSTVLSC